MTGPSLAVKPTSRPRVDGFKATYRVGDVLNMTCSLADTFPAANLTWFFSGEKVRKDGDHPKTTFAPRGRGLVQGNM